MVANIVLITLGIVALVESLLVLFFPKAMIKIGRSWMKNIKAVRKAGVIELIVAIILILIGMNI